MKRIVITFLAAGFMFAGCNKQETTDNPLLQEWETPFETAPFSKIKPEHYIPAFHASIAQHEEEIKEIVSNSEAPTFEKPLQHSTTADRCCRVSAVFSTI